MTKILPPLKRNWKLGSTQIGLFIRTSEGSVWEMSSDSVSDPVAKLATELLQAMCAKKE